MPEGVLGLIRIRHQVVNLEACKPHNPYVDLTDPNPYPNRRPRSYISELIQNMNSLVDYRSAKAPLSAAPSVFISGGPLLPHAPRPQPTGAQKGEGRASYTGQARGRRAYKPGGIAKPCTWKLPGVYVYRLVVAVCYMPRSHARCWLWGRRGGARRCLESSIIQAMGIIPMPAWPRHMPWPGPGGWQNQADIDNAGATAGPYYYNHSGPISGWVRCRYSFFQSAYYARIRIKQTLLS